MNKPGAVMKTYIKENYLIILATLLPFLVILLFSLAKYIPAYFVPNPQYDFIFTSANAKSIYSPGYVTDGMHVEVMNNKLKVSFICGTTCQKNPNLYLSTKTLYYFDAKQNKTYPIALDFLDKLSKPSVKPIDVTPPQMVPLTIDASPTSPDGYEFQTMNNGWDYFLIFNNQPPTPVLHKNGKTVVLLRNIQGYGFYKLIGWVRKDNHAR